MNSSFTVRKISFGEGVERVFPLYSPSIWEIEVVRKGIVRRAKLYYLRDLRGKASRIAEDTEAQRELIAVQAEEALKRPRREKLKKEKPKDEKAMPRRQGRRQEVGAPWRSARSRPRRRRRRRRRAPCSRRSGTATSSHRQDDGTCVIYIDRHLVHEVTSPQAFEGLRMAGRPVRRPDATIAVADHNTPTTPVGDGGMDEESRIQVETLEKNVADFGVPYFGMDDPRRGIVHVIGPEQGLTLPGMTIVCGDSHTSTHGAFGALAFGIGTSEVEHVLATQTLIQKPAKNMRVTVEGSLPLGVTAKDVILADHRQARHRRRHRLRDRVCRPRDPRADDGRPHDGLQHVDRGGRARRPDRARRDDLQVSRRPALRAEGRRLGPGARPVAAPAVRQGRALRPRARPRRRGHPADGHLGHQPAGRAADHRRRSRSGQCAGREQARGVDRARSPTWA